MAQNKKNITPENITEWLSSTGFLLPRNEVELERFEKLYGDVDFGLTGKEIDPSKIINGTFREAKVQQVLSNINQEEFNSYRIAARNGNNLPKNIMDKIKKNQTKSKDDKSRSENTNR